MRIHVYVYSLSVVLAVFLALLTVSIINYKLSKFPLIQNAEVPEPNLKEQPVQHRSASELIVRRNLFRAKLEAEIPKPKSEKEIELEQLENLVKEMTLKGVFLGKNLESYAVIDRGAKKGVWAYGRGEVIEKGLMVSDIKLNEVLLQKGEFAFTLKLFAKGYEKREPLKRETAEKKESLDRTIPQRVVRKEGNRFIIDREFASKVKADRDFANSLIASVSVKANVDPNGKPNGFKIVSIDKGTVAERMGILPGDVVQEVNGFKLTNHEDISKAYEALKDATRFEVKVLRRGKATTLYYEIK